MVSSSSSVATKKTRSVSQLQAPSQYEELFSSYPLQWKQYKEESFRLVPSETTTTITTKREETTTLMTTIYGLTWVEDRYLVACTNSGELGIWALSSSTTTTQNDDDDDDDDDDKESEEEEEDVDKSENDNLTNENVNSNNPYYCNEEEDLILSQEEEAEEMEKMQREKQQKQKRNPRQENETKSKQPMFRTRISNGILYSIHFQKLRRKWNGCPQQEQQNEYYDSILIASGEEGIFIFDWKNTIQARLEDSFGGGGGSQTTTTTTRSSVLSPRFFIPSPSSPPYQCPIMDTQLLLLSSNDNDKDNNCHYYLFGIASNNFCYQWELQYRNKQQPQQQTKRGDEEEVELVLLSPTTSAAYGPCTNLRSIKLVHNIYSNDDDNDTSILTNIPTNSDDGEDNTKNDKMDTIHKENNKKTSYLLLGGNVLQIWDIHTQALMEQISIGSSSSSSSASSSSISSGSRHVNKKKRTTQSSSSISSGCCVSSITVKDKYWWVVAGANICLFDKNISNNRNNTASCIGNTTSSGGGGVSSCNGGFLATYHVPTKSWISIVQTRETPQQLNCLLDENNKDNFNNSNTLISVANEGVISYWNLYSLERKNRIWCSPPCVYALAKLSSSSSNGNESGTIVSTDSNSNIYDYSNTTSNSIFAIAGVGNRVDLFEVIDDDVNNNNNNGILGPRGSGQSQRGATSTTSTNIVDQLYFL